MKTPSRIGRLVPLLAVTVLALSGCGLSVPTDPEGTLDRVTGGALRAGASISGELVSEHDGRVTGSAAELVEGFAAARDARVEWTVGSEETLVGMLESGSLDVVVGGMTDQTPWTTRAGATRGFPGIPGADGRSIVMLVPLGENALLSSLETYLDGEVGR